jgi:hypothetical protein
MRRENERGPLVVDGDRTDDGECCSLVVEYELGASEHSELPAGVAHLLTADDVLADGKQCGTYLAVCGALVPASSLPSSLCPPGCECDCALYCPQCVRHVVRYAAERMKSGEDEPHREYPGGAPLRGAVPGRDYAVVLTAWEVGSARVRSWPWGLIVIRHCCGPGRPAAHHQW